MVVHSFVLRRGISFREFFYRLLFCSVSYILCTILNIIELLVQVHQWAFMEYGIKMLVYKARYCMKWKQNKNKKKIIKAINRGHLNILTFRIFTRLNTHTDITCNFTDKDCTPTSIKLKVYIYALIHKHLVCYKNSHLRGC